MENSTSKYKRFVTLELYCLKNIIFYLHTTLTQTHNQSHKYNLVIPEEKNRVTTPLLGCHGKNIIIDSWPPLKQQFSCRNYL